MVLFLNLAISNEILLLREYKISRSNGVVLGPKVMLTLLHHIDLPPPPNLCCHITKLLSCISGKISLPFNNLKNAYSPSSTKISFINLVNIFELSLIDVSYVDSNS